MIQILSSLIVKISNTVGFIIFFIIYLVSFYLYFFSGYPFSIKNIIPYNTERNITDSHFFYSPETAYEAYYKTGIPDLQYFNSGTDIYNSLVKFGYDGRRIYEHILLADILYPTIYGFFYSIILTLILKKAFPENSRLWELNIIPFGATLFDYLENASIIQIIIAFPAKFKNIGSLPGYFTMLKHTFLMITEAFIVIGIVIIVYNKIKAKSSLEPAG